MKKIILLFMITLLVVLPSCKNKTDSQSNIFDDKLVFNAKVVEIREIDYVLVEVIEGDILSHISSDDKQVLFNKADLDNIDISLGDIITIKYGGYINQSLPLQVDVESWSIFEKSKN